jgi:hypothetical protein
VTMDSDFLNEYHNREIGFFKKNTPLSERFKQKQPIYHIVEFGSASIWSQIALSGTAIIPLFPIPSDYFEKMWKISANNFPELIQFIKDTKKIQFVLAAPPKEFKEFDYLEPIFQEFSPPMFSSNLNLQDPRFQNLLNQCGSEFNTLVGLSSAWQRKKSSLVGQQIVKSHIKAYTALRYYGLDEIADTFINNFLINPDFADDYLWIAEKMILHPIDNSLKANLALNVSTIQKANKLGLQSQLTPQLPSFPEVGSFLMKKCTHYPESLEACKRLIDRYEDNDLYKVHSALNEAVIERNDSSIIDNKDELGEILDNIWEDTKIKDDVVGYNCGITVTCGVVGYCLGGAPGLLASIGLKCIDKSKYFEQFSELIAKKVTTPYMATIFDFKKKYSV